MNSKLCVLFHIQIIYYLIIITIIGTEYEVMKTLKGEYPVI